MSAAIGVDLALTRNSTAFVAAYPGPIIRVGEIVELRPAHRQPLKLSQVMAEGCDFAERHGARLLHSDHHVLEPAREHLREGFSLEPVSAKAVDRVERFIVVRSLFNEGRIKVPGCYQKLIAQLRDVVSKPIAGGLVQIILRSRGMQHSDIAAAFVLAAWAAAMQSAEMGLVEAAALNDAVCPDSRWEGSPSRGF
jgi:hypothetical protein